MHQHKLNSPCPGAHPGNTCLSISWKPFAWWHSGITWAQKDNDLGSIERAGSIHLHSLWSDILFPLCSGLIIPATFDKFYSLPIFSRIASRFFYKTLRFRALSYFMHQYLIFVQIFIDCFSWCYFTVLRLLLTFTGGIILHSACKDITVDFFGNMNSN